MKSILAFIFFYVPIMATLNAVNPSNLSYPLEEEGIKTTLTVKKIVHSNNKQWANIVGKKLKWNEKLALNILRKKLKKKAKANPTILDKTVQIEEGKFNINDFALLAGVTSIVSTLLLIFVSSSFFVYLSLIAAPVAIITGVAGLSLEKPGKSKAIWGIVLGLLIGGLWLWAYSAF